MKGKIRTLLALHVLLVIYSFSGILSKLASGYAFMSVKFIGCYVGIITLLGVYAICWQQIIKRIPLTTAYANRAVAVVWGMIWGVLLFSEQLNPLKVIGGIAVLTGVALYAIADGREPAEGGHDDAPVASHAERGA